MVILILGDLNPKPTQVQPCAHIIVHLGQPIHFNGLPHTQQITKEAQAIFFFLLLHHNTTHGNKFTFAVVRFTAGAFGVSLR